LSAAPVALHRELREHRKRDLRRRAAAQIQADRGVHGPDALLRQPLLAEHPLDEDRLALAAQESDVPRARPDRAAQALRVELVAAGRDDDEAVPAGREGAERRA